MTATALVTGIGGVLLATRPVTFTVGMSATGVRIDGALLSTTEPQTVPGVQLFSGAASLAINTSRGGTSRAGAVMTWGGLATTGQCVLVAVASGASDACRFAIGPTRLTAVDTFDARAHVWHRHYADGVDVAIAVPPGSPLIPIPFPLGH